MLTPDEEVLSEQAPASLTKMMQAPDFPMLKNGAGPVPAAAFLFVILTL